MVTAVPSSHRRSTVAQEPALPAVQEGVIVTALAAASESSEVRLRLLELTTSYSVSEFQLCQLCTLVFIDEVYFVAG